jgi:DNA repair exonuclease SbcCD nuclease subunit
MSRTGSREFPKTRYRGLLAIGDPHLEGRVPGFRKDDYPQAVLDKLRWCLNYAAGESLLPIILGDVFQLPRDNPNWLLVDLLELLEGREVLAIYGNHDVHENSLTDDDSISILETSHRLRLLSKDYQYRGLMNGKRVVAGGTPWGQWLPESFASGELFDEDQPLVVWFTHHDVAAPGYEGQGFLQPRELPGISLVVNGHIHRRLEDVIQGGTRWMTPGNISRRARSDATRDHVPSTLRIDVADDGLKTSYIEVPHRPFEDVFHAMVADPDSESRLSGDSAFITGLAELQARRTDTGEGLATFLDQNLDQFEPDVAEEVQRLARTVGAQALSANTLPD